VGPLPVRASRFRRAVGWPQLRPSALSRLAFLALTRLAFLALTRLAFLALTRLAFLALTRLGLSTRQVRPQRRREPLLILFGAPMGHASDLGRRGGMRQAPQAKSLAGSGPPGIGNKAKAGGRPGSLCDLALAIFRRRRNNPTQSRNLSLRPRFSLDSGRRPPPSSRLPAGRTCGGNAEVSNGPRVWRRGGPFPRPSVSQAERELPRHHGNSFGQVAMLGSEPPEEATEAGQSPAGRWPIRARRPPSGTFLARCHPLWQFPRASGEQMPPRAAVAQW
jgi:hypothetical protein